MRNIALPVAALAVLVALVPRHDVRAADGAPGPDGEALFRQRCAACHSTASGRNGVGPSLAGVVSRRAGSMEGFASSPALRTSGIVWDTAQLDRYLAAPARAVPGTRMPLAVPDATQRAAIIRYLATLK